MNQKYKLCLFCKKIKDSTTFIINPYNCESCYCLDCRKYLEEKQSETVEESDDWFMDAQSYHNINT